MFAKHYWFASKDDAVLFSARRDAGATAQGIALGWLHLNSAACKAAIGRISQLFMSNAPIAALQAALLRCSHPRAMPWAVAPASLRAENKTASSFEANQSRERLIKVKHNDNYQIESSQTASPLRTDIFFSFELKSFQNLQEEDLKVWEQTYPAANIKQEILKMTQWCLSNPTKSKSKKLWRKFITNWLNKANEESINRSAYQQKKNSDSIININQSHVDYAKSIYSKFNQKIKRRGFSICLGHDYIEISPDGGNGKPFNLKFDEHGFKDQLDSHLRKFGISLAV